MLTLTPPIPADAEVLLAFELRHRAYFERWINARPAAFYNLEGVAAAIQAARDDAQADRGYQYLARSPAGELLGRVNLSQVKRTHFHSASLGYRVTETAAGRGVAREMVRQVCALAFGPHGLKRLEATARPDNLGSTRVLQANGFAQFGHSRRSLELSGQWFDLLHFEAHAPG
ncbi:ribosomal-protein-alanine N-acetyltransferase [Inhella inkyongensis]|uniref:Ribosomal-protein-alanine N-acetyltransferase n=1 Tax=Inhella inkyongensis TaxID=392593 RepID=A0A840S8N3_9BURK|nr:GNAT family N-acetyltransferase [Inhella inkyongensis]MBB5205154.1 ribosomal-protein-alanine N-acetyltransferase [Inhella inkyongensis]